jgi:hypothetical protein
MNDVGFTASPEPYMVQGWGEGFKKNPQPSHGRLGILPADTLHSLILEDLFVKNIQAGFLTLGSSYFLRLPILRSARDSGSLQVSSPITAAGPSPTFSVLTEITGFPFSGYRLLNNFF